MSPRFGRFGNFGEDPWYVQIPKNKDQITTVNEAAAYAQGSYKDALTKCPKAAAAYTGLKNDILAGKYGALFGIVDFSWQTQLAAADALCKANLAPSSYPSQTPAPGGEGTQPSPPVPPVPATTGGMPWWIWLVGGAALYLIFGKKKGGGKKKSRR